jgi:gluconate 5-dehydrogenase
VKTQDLFDLTGKTAIVVGASEGGLGAASAQALADLGAKVYVADLQTTQLQIDNTVATINASGGTSKGVICDVTDQDSLDRLVAHVVDENRTIDIVINHAGSMLRKSALETTRTEWDSVINTNVTGAWQLAKAAVPHMGDGGRIINFGSVYTNIVGALPEAAYYAAKAAVSNLSRGLAMEFANRGITVNCVAPGVFYPTRITAALAQDPERLDKMRNRTMLGRLGDPSKDLKGVIAFLAAPASAYVTGQTLMVDGGWSAW